MLDLKKYIKNGVVDRVKIALDVKRLILIYHLVVMIIKMLMNY